MTQELLEKLQAIDANQALTLQEKNSQKQALLKKCATTETQAYSLIICIATAKYLCDNTAICDAIKKVHQKDCILVLLSPITAEQDEILSKWFIKRLSAYHTQKQCIVPEFALSQIKDASISYVAHVNDTAFEKQLGASVIMKMRQAVNTFNIEFYDIH